MPAGDFGPPGGRVEITNVSHAEAARRLVHLVRAARLAGNDCAAKRASGKLRRHLDAHIGELRRARPA